MVKIFETDNYIEIAMKIFDDFDINQSCCIRGFVLDGEELIPKGNLVLENLRLIDERENTSKRTHDGRRRRIHKMPKDTIGGYLAHKIFKHKTETREDGIVVSIWRIQ